MFIKSYSLLTYHKVWSIWMKTHVIESSQNMYF